MSYFNDIIYCILEDNDVATDKTYYVGLRTEIKNSKIASRGSENKYATYNYRGSFSYNENVTGKTAIDAFEKNKYGFIETLNEYLSDQDEDSVGMFEDPGNVAYNDTEDTYIFRIPFFTQHEVSFSEDEGLEDLYAESYFYVVLSLKPIVDMDYKSDFIFIYNKLKNKTPYDMGFREEDYNKSKLNNTKKRYPNTELNDLVDF
jgi:hypothetical protein